MFLLCLILLLITIVYIYHFNWFCVTFFNDQSKKAILKIFESRSGEALDQSTNMIRGHCFTGSGTV